MNGLLVLSGLLGLLIVVAGWRLLHQIKRKKLLSGILWAAQEVALLSSFLLVLMIFSNLHTYQRLTYEALVADVYIRQLGTRKYQLSLSLSNADEDQAYYVLHGDQWQLDAKILKWKGWANLLGLDSYYQLDRLSGRYADINEARVRLPKVYDLSQAPRGLNIWELKRLLREKLGFVDAVFGQSVFMPMLDGAHYQVVIGQSGLVTRPANEIARSALP